MKLKELFSKQLNKNNHQINLSVKKKSLSKVGCEDVDDLLNMNIDSKLKKIIFDDGND